MPLSAIFSVCMLGYAALLLYLFKKNFKKRKHLTDMPVKQTCVGESSFDIIYNFPEKYRYVYFIPVMVVISLFSTATILCAVVFVTITDVRPEPLQFIPQIVPGNHIVKTVFSIMFSLVVTTGTALFLARLYSTLKSSFRKSVTGTVIREKCSHHIPSGNKAS